MWEKGLSISTIYIPNRHPSLSVGIQKVNCFSNCNIDISNNELLLFNEGVGEPGRPDDGANSISNVFV